jgi:hypothetical protein
MTSMTWRIYVPFLEEGKVEEVDPHRPLYKQARHAALPQKYALVNEGPVEPQSPAALAAGDCRLTTRTLVAGR